MVTTTGLTGPVKEPVPLPTQPSKASPAGGVGADCEVRSGNQYQPLGGLSAPELVEFIAEICIGYRNVRRSHRQEIQWSLKFAVMLVSPAAATLCSRFPPSLQETHEY